MNDLLANIGENGARHRVGRPARWRPPAAATHARRWDICKMHIPDPFDLAGYRSIVTGAGQGIGLALAEALAYAGSGLVLSERAPMRIMRAVLLEMVKAERGSVINIGSSWPFAFRHPVTTSSTSRLDCRR